ncbi:hypothetical protein ACQQ2N_12225 [Dokdonella sp. MW10]|uniref:hypothetical protein n=1 Tax=Dokdonella sp. MW10 TaxID=2992926 RepID=UPI003F806105
MNARKLMARLNPSTVKFDIGAGGLPDLTPQDVAAAVGMVRDELAREVFCLVWWPAGAALTRGTLLELIAARQRAELERQWKAQQLARLELHIAEENASTRVALTDADRRILSTLRAKLGEAKALCWPDVPAMYPVLRAAVLEELAAPNHCTTCSGRGDHGDGDLVVKCEDCTGTGIRPVSDRKRAARIGRDESTYRETWKRVFEWTFALVSEAETAGAKAVSAALG